MLLVWNSASVEIAQLPLRCVSSDYPVEGRTCYSVSQQPQFEIFASGLDHPECLAFDREGNVWAGGEAGEVYCINPAGAVKTVATLGGFNSGVAFSPIDGSLYVCNAKLGIFCVEADGRHSVFATHVGEERIACPNYPVFDRRGRMYVTDSGKWKERNGRLL